MAKRYWLMKSEPTAYSMANLQADKVTCWDGVRNYQARNFLRDDMQVGDRLFFYHSIVDPVGIAGEAEVIRAGYPDHTAWDTEDIHYDPKSDPKEPTWFMVDIQFVKSCREVITLNRLREIPVLEQMEVLKKGSRLSVQPVTKEEYQAILKLREW